MKNRKKEMEWNKDTKKMKRRDQVVISRLRTGYTTRPFCNVRLTVDHILSDCKETEAERRRANIQNKIWDKGKDGMKQLIEYVKKIGFHQDIDNMKEQNKNAI
jgi:hypothetical protein